MLALAIIATVLILTQPVPPKSARTEGMMIWIVLHLCVTITTTWLFSFKLGA